MGKEGGQGRALHNAARSTTLHQADSIEALHDLRSATFWGFLLWAFANPLIPGLRSTVLPSTFRYVPDFFENPLSPVGYLPLSGHLRSASFRTFFRKSSGSSKLRSAVWPSTFRYVPGVFRETPGSSGLRSTVWPSTFRYAPDFFANPLSPVGYLPLSGHPRSATFRIFLANPPSSRLRSAVWPSTFRYVPGVFRETPGSSRLRSAVWPSTFRYVPDVFRQFPGSSGLRSAVWPSTFRYAPCGFGESP